MTTNESTFPVDRVSPLDAGYFRSQLGVLFPSDHGLTLQKQTGGVAIHQLTVSGEFLPLEAPTMNRGTPEWLPEADGGVPVGETHPVADVDLTTIPDRDYATLPEWVQERGHFYNYAEFSQWLNQDDVIWYGWVNLIDELKQWNYDPDGSMDHTDRDMTDVWDSRSEIWAAIDDCLPFTYEEYDLHGQRLAATQAGEDFERPLPDEYPGPCEGIRWIRLTGSKTDRHDKPQAPWADALAGEIVLLLYPNCD